MQNNLSELIKAKAAEETKFESSHIMEEYFIAGATFALTDPSILNAAGLVRNQWVDCKERLPDYDDYVLWIDYMSNCFIDCLDKDGDDWLKHMTHWMSLDKLRDLLPQPPISINSKKEV